MHLSYAGQPLVRQDPDACQQGHALVLFGRRRRGRRLPRDQALAVPGTPTDGLPPRPRHGGLRRAATLILFILGGYGLLAYIVLPELWTHYEHQRGLANLPMVTRTGQGIPGDPMNVGLIGDQRDVICAMHQAGWDPAEPLTTKSSL